MKYIVQLWREQKSDVLKNKPGLTHFVADRSITIELTPDAINWSEDRWELYVLRLLKELNLDIPPKMYVFPRNPNHRGIGKKVWESDW